MYTNIAKGVSPIYENMYNQYKEVCIPYGKIYNTNTRKYVHHNMEIGILHIGFMKCVCMTNIRKYVFQYK